MYTIEQLERVIDGWNAAVTRGGDETTEDSAVIAAINFMGKLTLARQLLDTLKRIDAAAGIAANTPATGAIIDSVYENGWNECRAEFRKALGL